VQYLNYTPSFASGDIETVNTIRVQSTIPSFTIDAEGSAHFAYLGQPQDVYYATNQDGSWTEEKITNTPSWLTIPRIAIHPRTNQPLILVTQPNGKGVNNIMQVLEKRGDQFCSKFTISGQLTGAEDALIASGNSVEIVAGKPVNLSIAVYNPSEATTPLDAELQLSTSEAFQILSGQATQTVADLSPGSTANTNWAFQGTSAQSAVLSVKIFAGNHYLGQLAISIEISSQPIAIPGFSGGILILASLAGISALGIKSSKKGI